MGFLERLGELIQKNSESYYYKNNKSGVALKPQANATETIISPDIFDNNLAINEPAKFINKYICDKVISNALEKNPNIKAILEENGLNANYELDNARSIIMSHLIPTAKTAQKIYAKIGHSKKEDYYIYLTQAALLHDIGKVFIPSEILNKKGRLTPRERQIVELHNRLSYEIIKTTTLNKKVAQLCLEHHDYDKNLKRTEENQSLTVADVYCALKEVRSYKKAVGDINARAIMYDMSTKGKFDTKYINCI